MQLTHNNFVFILTEPQMGENIGFAIRSLKNFCFSEIRIINPRDGWPNEKAYATSAGAKDLYEQAQIYSNFDDAVADINYLISSSSRLRGLKKEIFNPENICEKIASDMKKANISVENSRNLKVGVVFGSEANGLTNEQISKTNFITSIPVNKDYGSMNLSHSVTIIAYELSKQVSVWQGKEGNLLQNNEMKFEKYKTQEKTLADDEIAPKSEILSLIDMAEEALRKKSKSKPRPITERTTMNISNIFQKNTFTKKDVRILKGIFSLND